MTIYHNQRFDAERALYGQAGIEVDHCTFAGPADGESALKECRDVTVRDSLFELRYPLWHLRGGSLTGCRMTESCRAALWYDSDLSLTDCALGGIKAVRECRGVTLTRCDVRSPEFGWQCDGLTMDDCLLESEYAFLHSRDLTIRGLTMQGKYSFQYVENARLDHCRLVTKDAFWHSRGITVTDSVIEGEYLGWYSQDLHLIRCTIRGTQPLCYARGLVLEDCRMVDTDLSFENSDVRATVQGSILSVKNPDHGEIVADSIGQILLDEFRRPGADCRITCRG